MAQYTCTLNYDGVVVTPVYAPAKGVNGSFSVGDIITFESPVDDAVIEFGEASPFEPKEMSFSIPKGQPLNLTLKHACFAHTATAPNATPAVGALPTEPEPGENSTFECRLTMQNGALVPVWTPGQSVFHVGV